MENLIKTAFVGFGEINSPQGFNKGNGSYGKTV